MTRKTISNLLLLCGIASSQFVSAQTGYQMKPATIQTRWAKQVSPANALKEYPRPQMVRGRWINLNGLWDYAITGMQTDPVTKYDGKILVPYPIESALSGVRKKLAPEELLWYRKSFARPVTKAGEHVLLHFGAVDWEATVYVNGQDAGHHTGGYTGFTLDITSLLKPGANELIVKVSDPLEKGIGPRGKQTLTPNSIWYTASSGIWQTAWLETVPASYIRDIKITPDVDRSAVIVKVNADVDGEITLQAAGKTVKGKTNTDINIPVSNPRLWSPDDPYLYDLNVTFGKDVVKSYFGLRKVEIKKDAQGIDRIFLNNKYTYNLGTLDQGFWPDGLYTAPTDEALRFDIEAIKAMGFNTIRKHIKVEPARWYYHADKLGMLVWQDMVQPSMKFGTPVSTESRAEFEKESAEILAQLDHFPSIVTWVLFNESWGDYDQARLTKWIKDTDPTRLVNGHSGAAIISGPIDDGAKENVKMKSINSDMTDVHSYPPPALPNHIDGKALVLGEFGGIGVQVYGHQWDDIASGWGYGGTVSGGVMKERYKVMTDSLVKFEKQGLSASIYTQPFDVESEQNGIMTYDREKIKIPFADLRAMHQQLWPTTKNYAALTKHIKAALIDTAAVNYSSLVEAYNTGKKDPVFLRRLALQARARKDKVIASKAANDYIRQVKDTFAETELPFIVSFTRSTKDAGFSILYNNIQKINSIMGRDKAEARITAAIEADEVLPNLAEGKPDWAAMEKSATAQYGELGKETVWQSKVLYAVNHQEWELLASSVVPWFEQYGKKREWIGAGLINNLAWPVFEHISDKSVLERVSKMTAHGMELEADGNLLDTHANLLYRSGNQAEALKWQEKAVAASPNNQEILGNFEKMKKGEKTWPGN